MKYPTFDRNARPIDTGVRRVQLCYIPERDRRRSSEAFFVIVVRAWRDVWASVAYADIWSDSDDPYTTTWGTILFRGSEAAAQKFLADYKPPHPEIYRDKNEVRYIDPAVEQAYIDVLLPLCDDGAAVAHELNSAYTDRNLLRAGC